MPKIALFPGSFDPFTKGHEDIVLRGLSIFDKIIVAMGHNTNKTRYIDIDRMERLINLTFEDRSEIEVIVYNELTAEFAPDRRVSQA